MSKSTTLWDIHNLLMKNNYELSLADLNNYDEIGESYLELIYYPYGNTRSVHHIVIYVQPSLTMMVYILTHDTIDKEFFDYLTFVEYHIIDTSFEYGASESAYEHYYYEPNSDSGAYTISSKNINSFAKLYSESLHFVEHIGRYNAKFWNDVNTFFEKHKAYLNSRGCVYITPDSEKNMLSINIGHISQRNTITIRFDIFTEKTIIEYLVDNEGYMANELHVIPDINKIKVSELNQVFPIRKDDKIANLLLKAYKNTTINVDHLIYAYNTLYYICDNTAYSNIDHLIEELESMYYEYIPQIPGIRKIIHNAIKEIRSCDEDGTKNFNIEHSYFKL